MTRAAAVLMLAALGCRSANSVVVVLVDADPDVTDVRQLKVTMINGMENSVRFFPTTPSTVRIAFRTSFGLVIPRARTGELGLIVEGLDADGAFAANGTDVVQLKVGGEVQTTIKLSAGPSLCGNNRLDGAEECDPGNRLSPMDDCDFRCKKIVPVLSADAATERLAPDGGAGPEAVPPEGGLSDVSPDVARDGPLPPPPDAARDPPSVLPRDGPPRRRHILMVVNDVTLPGSGDRAVRMRLEERGFLVTPVLDQGVAAMDASGKDLVLISDSSRSAAVGMKLRDVAIPVLCTDALLYPEMAMTGPTENTDHGFAPVETQVQILLPGHPLSAGLNGTVTVLNMPGRAAWGSPVGGSARAATIAGQASRAAIFAYETGVPMVGRAAPARRTGWPVSLNSSNLTNDGWRLFDAAVEWTMLPP